MSLYISQCLLTSLNISQYLSISLIISQYLPISPNIPPYLQTSVTYLTRKLWEMEEFPVFLTFSSTPGYDRRQFKSWNIFSLEISIIFLFWNIFSLDLSVLKVTARDVRRVLRILSLQWDSERGGGQDLHHLGGPELLHSTSVLIQYRKVDPSLSFQTFSNRQR